MKPIIKATALSRWYGEVIGLNDLNVEIQPGITGLLGPNGAGKSTLMKLLVGEMRPSSGSLEVLGHTPFANLELYGQLGFCPQQDALYDHMSGLQFVTHCMRLAGHNHTDAKAAASRALQRVNLQNAMNRPVSGYSKGMRQRTKLAQAFAHTPKLIIADEPLTGLDPVARHQVLELYRELGESGTSLVISSHVLHEVQSLTQRIVLIHRGRLLAQGSVEDIRQLLSSHPRKVHLKARDPRALARALLELPHVNSTTLKEDTGDLHVETRDIQAFHADLPALASRTRSGIESLESSDASLDAVFDYLVG
ncbi:MAG: ABC transporter ATP-binding protein [Planctomycetota bacterium]|nr:ABC transporter ATP-binding protein [Planctomycetota bacterium]